MSDNYEPDAAQVSDDWLEAAGFAGLYLKVVSLPTSKDLWPAYYNLMMMARAQYAAEASYKRFQSVAAREDAGLKGIFQAYMELHLFIVSADLYWTTLKELTRYLKPQELKQAVNYHEHLASQTRTARNHMEHITERIREGRVRDPGSMSAKDFRRAMGTYDASSVTFGTERFDLGEIYEAIRTVGREAAPQLKALLDHAVTNDVLPRLLTSLRGSQEQSSSGENPQKNE